MFFLSMSILCFYKKDISGWISANVDGINLVTVHQTVWVEKLFLWQLAFAGKSLRSLYPEYVGLQRYDLREIISIHL